MINRNQLLWLEVNEKMKNEKKKKSTCDTAYNSILYIYLV